MLTSFISQISSCKVLVIGDLMLDTYTIGKARRISPEAPVAVVHVQREEQRPGGAGNVILNLISLGAEVVAIGRIGDDIAGNKICEILRNEKVDISGIFKQAEFPTPIKNRILAENQQIVRVDYETTQSVSEDVEKQILKALPTLMQGVNVIAISDYGKGLLSHTLLGAVIAYGRKLGIPVITDPKGVDFTKYKGTSVLKPNLGEAYAAANLLPNTPIEEAAKRILEQSEADTLMITRSEAGISLFYRNGNREDFPVRMREIKDVTGAGDTVLAMLACAMGNKLSMNAAAQLSNVAAGIAIERFGCARITLAELARRLLEEHVDNKIFDREHLFALKEALSDRQFVLLSLSSQEGLTSELFKAIRTLRQSKEQELLVHVTDAVADPEFIHILASLHDVNFIILNQESIKSLCAVRTPKAIYKLEKGALIHQT